MNIIDSPEARELFALLGVSIFPPRYADDIAPGGVLQIIHEVEGERRVSDAIWWLLLDHETLKPNYKYSSFNSKSTRLNDKRSISYKPYRESRCIIPASAFVEGLGDKKTYYKIELENSAIAFGGLFKEYINRETGEVVYAASVITLPPLLPEWEHVHPKSTPLMLPFENKELVDKWLSPSFHDVDEFTSLLEPRVTKRMVVTKIDRPSTWNPIAESFVIVPADSEIIT